MEIKDGIFFLLAFICIASALGVVLFKNIVHSALMLLLTFVATAGIFILLHADFVALVQILVYAGAVSVLLIFAIMFVQRGDIHTSNLFNKQKNIAFFLATGLMVLLISVIVSTPWDVTQVAPHEQTAIFVAELMFVDFVIAFEVAAVLLLIALIAAIALAKGVDGKS